MSVYQKMVDLNPDRNPVFTAVEQLKTPEEIIEFYSGYIATLKETTGLVSDSKDEPKAIVNSNIGYILGYYDKEIADRWMKILLEVSHPIFGRDIFSVSPEDAFEAGKIAGTYKE